MRRTCRRLVESVGDAVHKVDWHLWEAKSFEQQVQRQKLLFVRTCPSRRASCNSVTVLPQAARVISTQFIPLLLYADEQPQVAAQYHSFMNGATLHLPESQHEGIQASFDCVALPDGRPFFPARFLS